MDSKAIVSKNIKKYLKLRGKSQVSLAKELNLTKAAVSNWVNGSTSPDINSITVICSFLEISVNDLFDYYDEKNLTVEEKIILSRYRECNFRDAINILLEK